MTRLTRSFPLTDDVQIPAVGFGTYLIEDDIAADAVAAALSVGYRHIDTASGYGNEAGVGRGVRASGLARDEVFVTTKLWPGNPAWGQAVQGYEGTLVAAAESLDRLGLEQVDLYLIHAPYGGAERLN